MPHKSVNVVSSPISALAFDRQIDLMVDWAKQKVSRFVCVANVHMLMEAHWNKDFQAVLEKADLVTPDGMPLVWLLRVFGFKNQDRVAGLDILLALCKRAELEGHSVLFVGSTEETLARIRCRLLSDFPGLKLAGMISPPFRELTFEEDEHLVNNINCSGATIVFVAFGCPKQESWMAQHRDRIDAVMVGLGAAFPLYASNHQRVPIWIREYNLEGIYRLVQEPRRLWKRYITTIPPFLWLAMRQILMLFFNRKPLLGEESGVRSQENKDSCILDSFATEISRLNLIHQIFNSPSIYIRFVMRTVYHLYIKFWGHFIFIFIFFRVIFDLGCSKLIRLISLILRITKYFKEENIEKDLVSSNISENLSIGKAERFSLSDAHIKLAETYAELSIKPILDENEAEKIEHILQVAEMSDSLSALLFEIDCVIEEKGSQLNKN